MNDPSTHTLSPLQEGMVFNYACDPHGGVDIEQLICHFPEPLNLPCLKKAWDQLIKRHETLRTSIHWENLEKHQQRVHLETTVNWTVQDWSCYSANHQKVCLEAFLASDRKQGFDLTHAPLWRINVIRFGDQMFKMIWTFHHIILDGRSLFVLLKELFSYYDGFRDGTFFNPPTPSSYRDYIEWLDRQDWAMAEVFWRDYLNGAQTNSLQLPQTSPGQVQGEGYGELDLRLTKQLTNSLRLFSHQNDLSLGSVVQAAWALLLNRYTEERDIVFGAVRSCRYNLGIEGDAMIGLLVNTVPVRFSFNPDQPVLAWIKQHRQSQLQLRAHQHAPLLKIQDWSKLPKTKAVFETLFVFENYDAESQLAAIKPEWGRRTLRLLEQTNYPLTCKGFADRQMRIAIGYDRSRFEADTIRRMLGHLQVLLHEMASRPKTSLGKLNMLTTSEKKLMLLDWNATATPYDTKACIHQLFERQAALAPEKVAAICLGEEITYGELNQRANQVAVQLRKVGIGAGNLVAVYLERSLDMIVAVLGVLKSGAAYVPLTPRFPEARAQWILENFKIPALITHSSMVNRFDALQPSLPNLKHCFAIDRLPFPERALENPEVTIHSNELAYIIFTSGSTGTPKGVPVAHRSVVNVIEWVNRTFEVGASDRLLFVTALSFDLSVYDIFGMLAAGGSIQVASQEEVTDFDRLLSLVHTQGITIWDSAPATLQAMTQRFKFSKKEGACKALRLVLLSGDWIPVTLPDIVRSEFPNSRVISLGGATEASIWSNFFPIEKVDPKWTSIPYGKPIQNAQYYVLDSNLQPCPIGVAGDLYISGDCLALGYAGDEELTAQKFIEHPFIPDKRIYRTGDRARYWKDGNLEFLGRLDQQVKVRGFRVELGEIETVLGKYPGVETAVVAARKGEGSERYLTAYVISKDGMAIPQSQLRAYLQERLPDYMIPSHFVWLKHLPLSSTGKLDRNLLPDPGSVRPESPEAFVAPKTPVEEKLAAIWREVLRLEQVSVNDNFFHLGGDSLSCMQILTRVREVFNLEVSIPVFFSNPILKQLAEKIGCLSYQKTSNQVVPLLRKRI